VSLCFSHARFQRKKQAGRAIRYIFCSISFRKRMPLLSLTQKKAKSTSVKMVREAVIHITKALCNHRTFVL
jgi:hypothetical protein